MLPAEFASPHPRDAVSSNELPMVTLAKSGSLDDHLRYRPNRLGPYLGGLTMRFTIMLRSAFCALFVCGAVAIATASDLYAVSGQGAAGELYIINPATGATITDIGPLNDSTARNFGMTALAFDPVSGVL